MRHSHANNAHLSFLRLQANYDLGNCCLSNGDYNIFLCALGPKQMEAAGVSSDHIDYMMFPVINTYDNIQSVGVERIRKS